MAKTLYVADRLVMFSDAVIAIAITLLILPLTDAASHVLSVSGDQFANDFIPKIVLFIISFAVVARFWWVHFSIFGKIKYFTTRLLVLNFIWLISIVVIPFTTELIASTSATNEIGIRVYIGTLFITACVGLLMQYEMVRTPKVYANPDNPVSLVGGFTATVLMGLALIVAIVFPMVGLWSLAILFLSGPCTKLFGRWYANKRI